MTIEERLANYPRHNSIKGEFCYELYKAMAIDKRIVLITADLGYKQFDPHFEDFPDRTFNVGASEQSAMGVAIGMALSGKIPFVYSITTFLIYRPFEWLRTYLNNEKIPVKLVGSGLDRDYEDDGITHQCEDLDKVLNLFKNIKRLTPKENKDVKSMLQIMLKDDSPYFIGLHR